MYLSRESPDQRLCADLGRSSVIDILVGIGRTWLHLQTWSTDTVLLYHVTCTRLVSRFGQAPFSYPPWVPPLYSQVRPSG